MVYNYTLHFMHTQRHRCAQHKTDLIFINDRTYSYDLETGSKYKYTNTHIDMLAWVRVKCHDLKQDVAKSAPADSTHNGVQ